LSHGAKTRALMQRFQWRNPKISELGKVWRRLRGETPAIQSQQLGNQVTQVLGNIRAA
jgi:hypothetical protein